MTQEYTQCWRFNNGHTSERMKFYENDKTAIAGTLQSFKRSKPELGEVVVLFRDGDEIACLRAGDVMAGRVLGTTLKLS